MNASSNWWGTTSSATIAGMVQNTHGGSVDYSPFLLNGTDVDGIAPGFQGDFSELRVAAGGAIQEGLDAADVGGVVYVDNSTYTENVLVEDGEELRGTFTLVGTLAADDGTIKAGNSPGIISSGSLSLTGSSTLEVEVIGTTPGTGYSQYVVTGSVTLGGAVLDLSGTYAGSFGDTLTIIDNDGSGDAVSGTFDGLSDGSFIVFNGRSYKLSYAGGDGNDVTLSIVNQVWVNDTWIITNNVGPRQPSAGDTVMSDTGANDTAIANLVFGFNAFASVASALAAVPGAGIVNVLAGTYAESLLVGKNVTIAGQSDTGAGAAHLNAGAAFTAIDISPGFNVTISGLEISNYFSTGIHIPATSTLSLNGSTINGGLTGVWVDGGTLAMDDSVIAGVAVVGVQVGNTVSATITDSEISGMATTAAGVSVSAGHVLVERSIIENSNRGVLVSATGTAAIHGSKFASNSIAAIVNGTATTVDASGNWWGSNVEGTVAGSVVGPVDFTPYLNADESVANQSVRGFTPDYSHLHVTTQGGQTGADGRVQEGVTLVDAAALWMFMRARTPS